MSARSLVCSVVIFIFTSGCATVPDVTVPYYFPRAETSLTVTQTIGCTPLVANVHRALRTVVTVAATTTNSADTDWLDTANQPQQGYVHFAKLNGTFSDGDATVTLTPDGRLSSINATSTGEGATVIKNLITVAGAVAAFGGPAGGPFVKNDTDKGCDAVDQYAPVMQAGTYDPTKPVPSLVTLTYSLAVRYDFSACQDLGACNPGLAVDTALSPAYTQGTPQTQIVLIPDATAKPAHDAIRAALGSLGPHMDITLSMLSNSSNLRVLGTTTPLQVPTGGGTPLQLTRVALVNLAIAGYVADLTQETQIWAGIIPAPTHTKYELPLPSPAVFGKTAFGLSLSDYGSITSVHYGSNAAAPDVSNTVGAIATALQPQTPEDRAKEIQGQADLIAQQQRLIACELTPAQCK